MLRVETPRSKAKAVLVGDFDDDDDEKDQRKKVKKRSIFGF